MQFRVEINRDPVSGVWITKRSDVPGLAMYDQSHDRLLKRFQRVIPYLIQVNKIDTGRERAVELAVKTHGGGEVTEVIVHVDVMGLPIIASGISPESELSSRTDFSSESE